MNKTLAGMIMMGMATGIWIYGSHRAERQAMIPVSSETPLEKVVVSRTLSIKKELPPQDQKLLQAVKSLNTSHDVFTQVWAHLWSDRLSRPMSVFSELSRTLQAHKNPQTSHFSASIGACPSRSTHLHWRTANELIVRLSDCKSQPHSVDEMARLFIRNERHWSWVFMAAQMPRGAGSSLSFLQEKITCEMYFDDRDKLQGFECQNLGQNFTRELHVRFDQFKYAKNAQTLVTVQGKKYNLLTTPVCDAPLFCTQIQVPLLGKIEINEDERSAVVMNALIKEREKQRLDVAMAERKKMAELEAKKQSEDQRKAQLAQAQAIEAGLDSMTPTDSAPTQAHSAMSPEASPSITQSRGYQDPGVEFIQGQDALPSENGFAQEGVIADQQLTVDPNGPEALAQAQAAQDELLRAEGYDPNHVQFQDSNRDPRDSRNQLPRTADTAPVQR